MSKSIAAVLRDAAKKRRVPTTISWALGDGDIDQEAFCFALDFRLNGRFGDLTNEERSAFLYLCSLIAEDEE